MAKAFKKMFAISIMAVLCVLTLCAPVALADSDKSQTHLYFEGEDGKAPFNKQDITVTIGDKDYNFNSSGSNSWKNSDSIGEQNLGDNESIRVTITDNATGSRYDAELVNHSSANGNNKNNKKGTDNYNIVIKTPAVETPAEDNEEPIVENNEEPIVENNEEPIVEDNEEPVVENNEEPVVEDDEEPVVEDDEEPVVEDNEEPVVEDNEEPVVENNEEPIVEDDEEPVVEDNEEPIVENNEEPIVEDNEEPIVEDNEEPIVENNEEPIVEDNEEPIVEDNEEPVVEDDEEPVVEDDEEPVVENNEEKGPMMFAKQPAKQSSEESSEKPAQQPAKKTVSSGAKQSSRKSSGSASDKNVANTSSASELVVILDEDVPLAEVPETGDISAVWALMSFVSVGGLVLMGSKRK